MQIAIAQAITSVSTCLLSAGAAVTAVTEALKTLLKASGVSRVYLFENFDFPGEGLCMKQAFEVCAPDVPAKIDNPLLQHVVYSQGFDRWRESLVRGAAIRGNVREFPDLEREILEPQGILSILVLPIVVDGRWWGFIGFDETRGQREWKDLEVTLLRTAAEILGSFFTRQRAEKKLIESQDLFSLFMRHSPIYVFIKEVTPTESRVLQASENYKEMLGVSSSDMIGKTMSELFPAEFAAKITSDDWKVVSNRTVITLEEELKGRQYTTIKFPVCHGDKTFLAGYTIDNTERKKAEADREKLQTQLTQAKKLEAVGRLAGGVAHDFNNMLQAILANVELAFQDTRLDPELRDRLAEIRSAGQRSADLTRQLLTFARRQIVSPKNLDLNDAVPALLKMLRRLVGENLLLSWIPCPGKAVVRIDPSQLDQVLTNLCVNARDAISGNGKITIEAGRTELDPEYCKKHPGALPGPFAILSVSDNGVGMEKEVLENIFEPFFTTKPEGLGTGLGLAMVYGIVRQNKGVIEVASEKGVGTRFKIFLPEISASGTKSIDEKKSAIPRGNGQIILIVEDEPAILKATKQLLTRLGYVVETASCAEEALALVADPQKPLDLLLTDVVMPRMNGSELEKRIKETRPGLQTIFMSGYTAEVIARHGILDPGIRFIQKPFSIQDLATVVNQALKINEINRL